MAKIKKKKKNIPETAELVWVGSSNFGDKRMFSSIVRLVRGKKASVLGWQEGLDRTATLKRLLAYLRTWEQYYDPQVPAANAVPIGYDTIVWKKGVARSVLISLRTWVGKKGAGPTFMHAKVINEIVLIHRATGQRFRFMNLHVLPSYTRNDLPADEKAARMREAHKMIDRLCDIVRKSKIPCIVMMDLNGTEKEAEDLYRKMKNAGLQGFTERPTLKNRAIDHVAYSHPELVKTGSLVLVDTKSDHKTVLRPIYPIPRKERRQIKKQMKKKRKK